LISPKYVGGELTTEPAKGPCFATVGNLANRGLGHGHADHITFHVKGLAPSNPLVWAGANSVDAGVVAEKRGKDDGVEFEHFIFSVEGVF